jgi:hypothetical protein
MPIITQFTPCQFLAGTFVKFSAHNDQGKPVYFLWFLYFLAKQVVVKGKRFRDQTCFFVWFADNMGN